MDSPSIKLTPCRFKIPLAYNDGTPVEEDRLDAMLDQLYIEFGGSTVEGTEKGTYRRDDTGEKQVEYMLKVCVGVEGEKGVDRLRQMVSEIGGELDQESMYFEVSTGSVIELIPSQKKGDR
ncbi:MAG: hypothetical protein QM754_07090 [Tepidisphaeraceae bacterium]